MKKFWNPPNINEKDMNEEENHAPEQLSMNAWAERLQKEVMAQKPVPLFDEEDEFYMGTGLETVPDYIAYPWRGEYFRKPEGVKKGAVPAFLIYPASDMRDPVDSLDTGLFCTSCNATALPEDRYCRWCGKKLWANNPFVPMGRNSSFSCCEDSHDQQLGNTGEYDFFPSSCKETHTDDSGSSKQSVNTVPDSSSMSVPKPLINDSNGVPRPLSRKEIQDWVSSYDIDTLENPRAKVLDSLDEEPAETADSESAPNPVSSCSEESETRPAFIVYAWDGESYRNPNGLDRKRPPTWTVYPADGSPSPAVVIPSGNCPSCHEKIALSDVFCRHCGFRLRTAPATEKQ